MSEIKKGDLVMVVRGKSCCGKYGRLGEMFIVERFRRNKGECPYCGIQRAGINAMGAGHTAGYRLERLKRIPPLSELTDTPTREELTA